MQRLTKTKPNTLRSERRSLLKKNLTEPTLSEMSGLATNRELTLLERKLWLKRPSFAGFLPIKDGHFICPLTDRDSVQFDAKIAGSMPQFLAMPTSSHTKTSDDVRRALRPQSPIF